MHFDDNEHSGSDSDNGGGFEEDMEALRRACILTGTNPNDICAKNPNCDATTSSTSTTDAEEESDDDIELVRNLQKRFSVGVISDAPLTLKPICSLPPDDDFEDDFKTLRAIQRRFTAYSNGVPNESANNSLDKPEQVGVTNKIASEKEASNNLFVERSNNALEGFPNCVDMDNSVRENPEEDGDIVATDVPALPLKTSGLPKPALAFIDAIKKNRSCQKVIRGKLIQIEARMEEVRKLKERVKILKDFQVSCKKRTTRALSQKKDARVQLISAGKQRLSSKQSDTKIPPMYYGPSENPYAAIYREILAKFPISVIREKWSKKETENLAKGLKQQFQDMLLQQSLDVFNDADDLSGDASDFDSIIASIRDHDITPQNIRLFLPKANFEQLASMYVPGRSGAECQARWLNCEDPLINRNPWTNVEEKNLLHIIQQKGLSNWIDISVSLGTYRTPFQCLARYQRSLNASIIRREWTKEEDDKLLAAVEEFGESNWQNVASTIDGRTGTQCSNRWKKTLHPARKRSGKWTPEEDKRLKVAVKLFGPKHWFKIAQFVPGRMQAQCRERWANVLDPSLNLDKWTQEEDLMLEEAIKENGYSWSKVAACIPRRTDNQCRRRWMMLFPAEVPLLRAAKRMQRAAFISNFVDREAERPTLGPNDFVPLQGIDPSSETVNADPSAKKKKKKKKTTYRQKREHIQKDTSSCNACSDEVPRLTNDTEVEDSQVATTSCGDVIAGAKRSQRRKRKASACVATDTTLGNGNTCSDEVPRLTNDTTSCGDVIAGAKRSQRRKRKAGARDATDTTLGNCNACSDEVPRLTNDTEFEDSQVATTSCGDFIDGAKRSQRRKRKVGAGDATDTTLGNGNACSDEVPRLTNDTEVEDCQVATTYCGDLIAGVKRSQWRKRKAGAGDAADTTLGNGNACSDEVPRLTNDTEVEDSQVATTSCGDLVAGPKRSQRLKRKAGAGDATDTTLGNCNTVKTKRRKLKAASDETKSVNTAECRSSSLPNSTPVVATNKQKRYNQRKAKNVNMKTGETFLRRNDVADCSVNIETHSVLHKDDKISSETDAELYDVGDGVFGECPQSQSLPPGCVTPDVSESRNPSPIVACRRSKSKKPKLSDGAPSFVPHKDHEISSETDAELYDVGNGKFGECPQIQSFPSGFVLPDVPDSQNPSPSVACRHSKSKRFKLRDGASSSKVQEEEDDDTTLAAFLIPQSGGPRNPGPTLAFKRSKRKNSKLRDGDSSSKVPEGGPRNSSAASELAESHLVEVQCTSGEKYSPAAGFSNSGRPKRVKTTKDETSSPQMLDTESDEDKPLSSFLKKSKARRTKPAERANSIVREDSEKTRIEHVEMEDDMSLALFCKKRKQRRG